MKIINFKKNTLPRIQNNRDTLISTVKYNNNSGIIDKLIDEKTIVMGRISRSEWIRSKWQTTAMLKQMAIFNKEQMKKAYEIITPMWDPDRILLLLFFLQKKKMVVTAMTLGLLVWWKSIPLGLLINMQNPIDILNTEYIKVCKESLAQIGEYIRYATALLGLESSSLTSEPPFDPLGLYDKEPEENIIRKGLLEKESGVSHMDVRVLAMTLAAAAVITLLFYKEN